jgi:F-type H+-transporting ATPase subunit b
MVLLTEFSVFIPEPGLLIWTCIIFVLFWFIMSRFAWKPLVSALNQRSDDIQGALDEAKKAREEMANLQAENEKLLAQAREERSAILKEAKEAKDEIIAEAKERANQEYNRRMQSAMQDIENQKMAALVELKNKSGQMAIDIAEKILRKELGNNADQVAYAKNLAEQIKLN